jgi:glucan 1,3-beta-glucosidase
VKQLRGVNLGGWLVLEKWITPSLFEGRSATDEYGLCQELGGGKEIFFEKHRQEFITEADFKWIADRGLNAVRLPVGYWIFGDAEPYAGGIKYLDFAMDVAKKVGLKVIIDLHGVPGSQNGWDHSGKAGELGWHTTMENIDLTVDVISRLADRYKDSESLYAFDLLNEPRWDIPHKVLVEYYERAYQAVRGHCGDRVAVIANDAFRPFDWENALSKPQYTQVMLDTHLYQVFTDEDNALDIDGHILKTINEWGERLDRMQKLHPVVVGEWSIELKESSLVGLSEFECEVAARAYGATQLVTFRRAAGWFFWTYRTETAPKWNFRDCVEKGLLPAQYGD